MTSRKPVAAGQIRLIGDGVEERLGLILAGPLGARDGAQDWLVGPVAGHDATANDERGIGADTEPRAVLLWAAQPLSDSFIGTFIDAIPEAVRESLVDDYLRLEEGLLDVVVSESVQHGRASLLRWWSALALRTLGQTLWGRPGYAVMAWPEQGTMITLRDVKMLDQVLNVYVGVGSPAGAEGVLPQAARVGRFRDEFGVWFRGWEDVCSGPATARTAGPVDRPPAMHRQ